MNDIKEIISMVRDMNIGEEKELSFKAAVIMFWALGNGTWGTKEISDATGYSWSEINFIRYNFRGNGILVGDKFNMEGGEDEMENFMEVVLISMCGAGELARSNEDGEFDLTGRRTIKWDEFSGEVERLDSLPELSGRNIANRYPLSPLPNKTIVANLYGERCSVQPIKFVDGVVTALVLYAMSNYFLRGELVEFPVEDIIQIRGMKNGDVKDLVNNIIKSKEIQPA